MSITVNSLIARAAEMALVGKADIPQFQYLKTAEIIANALIPQVFQAAARDAAGDPQRFQQVLYSHSVSFTAGIAAIPATALTEYWDSATWVSSAQPTWATKISWIPRYFDFINQPDLRLGYFCENPSGSVLFTPPGSYFVPGGTNWSGTLTLSMPSSAPIPTDPNEVIDVQEEFEDSLITALASALAGEAAWQSLTDRLEAGESG